MKIFNVGWISNIILMSALIFSILLASGSSDKDTALSIVGNGFIIPYIVAIIANQIRLYGMPSAYYTDGTALGSLKKKFYWTHGIQLNALVITYIIILFSSSSN